MQGPFRKRLPQPTTGLDHSWIDRHPPGLRSGSVEPRNPAGLIWSQGWSHTRLGRRSARLYLLLLGATLVGTIAEALWTQFWRPYHLVAYRAVIERFEAGKDQIQPVEVEVLDGFTGAREARQLAERLASASRRTGSARGGQSYPIVVSTRARVWSLCDQERVLCVFHNEPAPVIQGNDWRPSRLDLTALPRSENLTNGDGGHR